MATFPSITQKSQSDNPLVIRYNAVNQKIKIIDNALDGYHVKFLNLSSLDAMYRLEQEMAFLLKVLQDLCRESMDLLREIHQQLNLPTQRISFPLIQYI